LKKWLPPQKRRAGCDGFSGEQQHCTIPPGGNCHAQGSAAQRGCHVDKFVSLHVRQRLMQKVRKP
jgi:hypothetical protein